MNGPTGDSTPNSGERSTSTSGTGRPRATVAALIVAVFGLTWWATSSDRDGPGADGGSPTTRPAVATSVVENTAKPTPGSLRFTAQEPWTAADLRWRDPGGGVFYSFAGGAGVGDLNGDGIDDLVVTQTGLAGRLLLGQADGSFLPVTGDGGLPGPDPSMWGASSAVLWADLDGDGDLDLFLGGTGHQPDRVLVNDRGQLREATAERGLGANPVGVPNGQGPDPAAATRLSTMGAAAADWDHDGDLDVMVARWAAIDVLPDTSGTGVCGARHSSSNLPADFPWSQFYENTGDGTFVDATERLGVDMAGVAGFTPVFADYDDDGWVDLFLTGDFCTSRLYHNEKGRAFRDVTSEMGVATDENGMGSAVEDIDGDGDLDWMVTSIASAPDGTGCLPEQAANTGCTGNRLYRNDGDVFVDVTDVYGVRRSGWAWGTAVEDFDNDGRREVVAVQGYDDPKLASKPDPDLRGFYRFHARGGAALWRGVRPAGPWGEAAAQTGFEYEGQGKALVVFDLDGDGDLDALVARTGRPPVLLRNDTPRSGHWLRVDLADPASANRFGIGARVRVFAGRRLVGRADVRAGSSFQATAPATLHFGLGSVVPTRVEVRWPDSESTESFSVETDRRVVVRRGAGAPN